MGHLTGRDDAPIILGPAPDSEGPELSKDVQEEQYCRL